MEACTDGNLAVLIHCRVNSDHLAGVFLGTVSKRDHIDFQAVGKERIF